jgi:AraC-like DNA-binding protein
VLVHYVLEGRGTILVEGWQWVLFETGSIILVPPHRSHGLSIHENDERIVRAAEHCVMQPNGLLKIGAVEGQGALRILSGAIRVTAHNSFGIFESAASPRIESATEVAEIRETFDILRAEAAGAGIGSAAIIESAMNYGLALLLREHPPELLDVSESDERLHNTARLLAATDLPIAMIAAGAGYANASQFSRAFRRAYDCTPARFRESATDRPVDLPPHGTMTKLRRMTAKLSRL